MLEGGLYLAGEGLLYKLDPRLKIGALVALGILITSVDAGGLLCLTGGIIVLFVLNSFPWRAFRSVVKASIILGLFYTLIMGWQWEEGLIFWQGQWSRDGIVQGLMMSWRILLIFILTRVFVAVTSPSEQGVGIAFFFRPFCYLTPKAADFALLLTLTLRFIPILGEEAMLLYKARWAKGGLAKNWTGKIKDLARLMLPLLRITLRRAEELAENLVARGYVSGGYRVLGFKEWERRDSYALIFLILWSVCTLFMDVFLNALY